MAVIHLLLKELEFIHENSDIDKMNRSVVLYYNHENDQYYKFFA